MNEPSLIPAPRLIPYRMPAYEIDRARENGDLGTWYDEIVADLLDRTHAKDTETS